MERITDPILIQYLNEYCAIQFGGELVGAETKDRAWFVDEDEQVFCLRLLNKKGEPWLAPLRKIPY